MSPAYIPLRNNILWELQGAGVGMLQRMRPKWDERVSRVSLSVFGGASRASDLDSLYRNRLAGLMSSLITTQATQARRHVLLLKCRSWSLFPPWGQETFPEEMETIWGKTQPSGERQMPSTSLAPEMHFLRKNNLPLMQLDHNPVRSQSCQRTKELKSSGNSPPSKWLCVCQFNFPPRF